MVAASAIGGASGWTDEMSSYFLSRRRRTVVRFFGLFEGQYSSSVAMGMAVFPAGLTLSVFIC